MNFLSRIALVLVAGLATVFASGCGCDSSSGSIQYENGNPIVYCTQPSDCPTGAVCAVDAQEACGAAGSCVMPTPISDSCEPVQQLACDCHNVTISWQTGCAGLPDNTAPAPILHMGSCNP